MRTRLLCVLALLVFAAPVLAQPPVINPSKVEVTASPDHNVTALGVDLVTSYRLTFRDGATVLGSPLNAGKPTPNAQGKFDVDIPATVLAVKNKSLTVTVEIVGPGGTVTEPVSDFFGYLGPPRGSGTKPSPKP